MNKKVVYMSLTAVIAAFAGGCSGQYNKAETDYLASKNGKTIVIPAPLSADNINNYYVLPKQDKNPQVSTAPPATRNMLT